MIQGKETPIFRKIGHSTCPAYYSNFVIFIHKGIRDNLLVRWLCYLSGLSPTQPEKKRWEFFHWQHSLLPKEIIFLDGLETAKWWEGRREMTLPMWHRVNACSRAQDRYFAFSGCLSTPVMSPFSLLTMLDINLTLDLHRGTEWNTNLLRNLRNAVSIPFPLVFSPSLQEAENLAEKYVQWPGFCHFHYQCL